ncbi:MAG: hypothetical protein RL336_2080 [Pseudomonadota bacterium]|jgi:arabinogalactan oligomer/maltooligosaccharide transport system substrate-binding protein
MDTLLHNVRFALVSLLVFGLAVTNTYANTPITLVTSHSESRLLGLIREEAEQQGLQLHAAFVDQDQLKSELMRTHQEDELPDVVIVPPDVSALAELHVDPLPEDWFLQSISPQITQQLPSVSEHRAIPFLVGNQLLQFYNKSLVNEPIGDWESVAASYPEPLFSWSYNEMYWFVPFVLSHGIRFLEGGEANLDTPEMAAALEQYRGLASRGVVDPNCNYSCSISRFINGKVPYHINGTWAVEQLKEALGDQLGVAVLPNLSGLPMRSYYSAYVIIFPAIHRHSDKKLAALKSFSRHLQSEDVQSKLVDYGYQMPINVASRLEFVASQNVIHRVFMQQLERSVCMPDSVEMLVLWDAMSRGFVRYNSGVLTAPAASRYMGRTFVRFNR